MNKYYQVLSYKSILRPPLRIPDAAQLRLLTNYASGQGFTVVEKYMDVETAKQTGRSGFASKGAIHPQAQKKPGVFWHVL
jgi:hypothetical protein